MEGQEEQFPRAEGDGAEVPGPRAGNVSKPATRRSGSIRIPATREAGSDPFQVAEPLRAHGESGSKPLHVGEFNCILRSGSHEIRDTDPTGREQSHPSLGKLAQNKTGCQAQRREGLEFSCWYYFCCPFIAFVVPQQKKKKSTFLEKLTQKKKQKWENTKISVIPKFSP